MIVIVGRLQALIDDGFYLLGSKVEMNDPGTIIRAREGVAIARGDKYSSIDIGAVKEYLIKLEEDEAQFLRNFPTDKRIKKHVKGLFGIISNLRVEQECRLRGNHSSAIHVIKRIYDDKDGMKFDLESKVLLRYIHRNIDVGL